MLDEQIYRSWNVNDDDVDDVEDDDDDDGEDDDAKDRC